MPSPETSSAVQISIQGSVCSLNGQLDFNNVRSALESVSLHIASNPTLTIDLAGISHSNSAGLAVMIEWLACARTQGHKLSFGNVPDSLKQLAEVCQVDSLI